MDCDLFFNFQWIKYKNIIESYVPTKWQKFETIFHYLERPYEENKEANF
jgi:hypothetical protein